MCFGLGINVRPFDRTDSSSVDIGHDDKFNTQSLISESFVDEFLLVSFSWIIWHSIFFCV